MGHSVNGRNLIGLCGVYFVIKGILNLVLGFSFSNIVILVVFAALAYLMLQKKPMTNYITAVLLVAIVLIHIKDNIKGFQVLYLAEAAIDCVCAFTLVANKDVREYFK
ncbi:hypothetical protein [Ruminococcus sp. NK3A76]|uniref:hypothetical protein n=1 Tax=Ruminococcus sp. NK3A76 TaxID=877411 RepID=UPI00048B06EA|nr:hypothetical protein [Ruminococcus sp. NK3A76]